MSVLANEPVVVGVLVSILTALAAKYGFKADSTSITEIVTGVVAVVGVVVRHYVTPTKKAPAPVSAPPAQPAPK